MLFCCFSQLNWTFFELHQYYLLQHCKHLFRKLLHYYNFCKDIFLKLQNTVETSLFIFIELSDWVLYYKNKQKIVVKSRKDTHYLQWKFQGNISQRSFETKNRSESSSKAVLKS